MSEHVEEEHRNVERQTGGTDIFDELLQAELDLRVAGEQLRSDEQRIDRNDLLDLVRHGPVLEALRKEPLDRREIEGRLDISRTTSHRFTRWLDEHGLVEKVDGRYRLTGKGMGMADEVLRFERNVATYERLTPLWDCICEEHQEFVIEPFADATVTTATPDDPYRPVRRFVSLADESTTLRGFNTTHMVPLTSGSFFDSTYEDTDTEIIYLPSVVETLFDVFPDRAREAIDRGHFALRTREALPYGLAIFDDRVGIGGYDETTGTMQVFVDTDAAIAREWAERVYTVYRDDSEPLDDHIDEYLDTTN
ncbi:helix-turn-helix transcriptional regulator [Haladaptatus sp. NG-SE-30]